MAHILDLSDSLLARIVSVARLRDRARFASFAAVCRRFYDLAFALPLTKPFDFGHDGPFRDSYNNIIFSTRKLAKESGLSRQAADEAVTAKVEALLATSPFVQACALHKQGFVQALNVPDLPACLLPLIFQYFPSLEVIEIGAFSKFLFADKKATKEPSLKDSSADVSLFDLANFRSLTKIVISSFNCDYIQLPKATLQDLLLRKFTGDNAIPISPQLVADIEQCADLVRLRTDIYVKISGLLKLRQLVVDVNKVDDATCLEELPGDKLWHLKVDFCGDYGTATPHFPNLNRMKKSLKNLDLRSPPPVPRDLVNELVLDTLKIYGRPGFDIEPFRSQTELTAFKLFNTISRTAFTPKFYDIVSKFTKVKDLRVDGAYKFDYLKKLFDPVFPNLEILWIYFNHLALDSGYFSPLELEEMFLSLDSTKIVDLQVHHISMTRGIVSILSSYENLKKFVIICGDESVPTDEWLNMLGELRNLEELTLIRTEGRNFDPEVHITPEMAKPRSLSLEVLTKNVSLMPRLKYLRISNYFGGFAGKKSAFQSLLADDMRKRLEVVFDAV